jgi:biotin-dependent carboxylase-like uncharacterized protein
MSVLEVLRPGMLTTVQDLGRPGYGPMGVSASGAADPVSLRVGNRLVGNREGAAALEMTMVGGSFRFPQGATVALAGGDFEAAIDDAPIVGWAGRQMQPGQTLTVGPAREGARCYLCVRGGIAVKDFLGSASTHLLSATGGLAGRALQKGDVLKIGPAGGSWQAKSLSARVREQLKPRKLLRVTAGPQADWFSAAALRQFYDSAFRIAEQSNRMGLRLEGPPIAPPSGREMITEGVSLGAIQVPSSGVPIILFVEQQTTGGYPKIANVISADVASLGQLRPRDEIRFAQVTLEQAGTLWSEQAALLAQNIFA